MKESFSAMLWRWRCELYRRSHLRKMNYVRAALAQARAEELVWCKMFDDGLRTMRIIDGMIRAGKQVAYFEERLLQMEKEVH